jgi:hypothetical protein
MDYFIGACTTVSRKIKIGCTFLKASPHFYFWLSDALLFCYWRLERMTAKSLRVSLFNCRMPSEFLELPSMLVTHSVVRMMQSALNFFLIVAYCRPTFDLDFPLPFVSLPLTWLSCPTLPLCCLYDLPFYNTALSLSALLFLIVASAIKTKREKLSCARVESCMWRDRKMLESVNRSPSA